MIPIKLDKEESVLVSGNFTKEDVNALHANPTLLSAKVSYIRNSVVNLYVKGCTTFVFTTDGLFELLVATVVNDFNKKGMNLNTVFLNRFPGMSHHGVKSPEEFTHLSVCFSDDAASFDPDAFSEYIENNVGCVLSPSRIKHRDGYIIPEIFGADARLNTALN